MDTQVSLNPGAVTFPPPPCRAHQYQSPVGCIMCVHVCVRAHAHACVWTRPSTAHMDACRYGALPGGQLHLQGHIWEHVHRLCHPSTDGPPKHVFTQPWLMYVALYLASLASLPVEGEV